MKIGVNLSLRIGIEEKKIVSKIKVILKSSYIRLIYRIKDIVFDELIEEMRNYKDIIHAKGRKNFKQKLLQT